MIGARLRISDVETCNTSVFCGFIVCWNKLYRQIYNSLEVLSIFVLGKRSPRYLPENFTEMAFVGKTRKLGNSLHCIIRMFRHLLCGVFYPFIVHPTLETHPVSRIDEYR